jgi:prolyl-tRNA editing enzyme YbaK/EbsC (Cys-tRNA(Pro) deacylase)
MTASDGRLPHGSVQRGQEVLDRAGHPHGVRYLEETARSAADAAAALGCAVTQIAKSLVFRSASNRPVLVIASGTNRVDEARVAAIVGEAVRKADAAFVREATGYAIGGVAPVGHVRPPLVVIDEDLWRHDRIWAAAGHPHAVFALSPDELKTLTAGTVAAVKIEA